MGTPTNSGWLRCALTGYAHTYEVQQLLRATDADRAAANGLSHRNRLIEVTKWLLAQVTLGVVDAMAAAALSRQTAGLNARAQELRTRKRATKPSAPTTPVAADTRMVKQDGRTSH